ncbi:MAG: hypothetical protein ACR2PL_23125 [Dehalococcoidia bacterium]
MRRFVSISAALLMLGSAAIGGQAHHASAEESWCWDDPIVRVNGVVYDINVGVNESAVAAQAHAAVVTLSVPVPNDGNDAKVLVMQPGAFTVKVAFVHNGQTPSQSTVHATSSDGVAAAAQVTVLGHGK